MKPQDFEEKRNFLKNMISLYEDLVKHYANMRGSIRSVTEAEIQLIDQLKSILEGMTIDIVRPTPVPSELFKETS